MDKHPRDGQLIDFFANALLVSLLLRQEYRSPQEQNIDEAFSRNPSL